MKKSDKKIIWLEDRIGRNQKVKDLILHAGFTLEICPTLKELKLEVEKVHLEPAQISGFILDILITDAHSLGDLDLSQIKTNLGNDTGMMVLQHFIRNTENHREISNIWRKHHVLMLSCLGAEFMNSRYGTYKIWEVNQSSYGETEWLSKGDDTGDREECNKRIKDWLNSTLSY